VSDKEHLIFSITFAVLGLITGIMFVMTVDMVVMQAEYAVTGEVKSPNLMGVRIEKGDQEK
jgi:hypothetical protein